MLAASDAVTGGGRFRVVVRTFTARFWKFGCLPNC